MYLIMEVKDNFLITGGAGFIGTNFIHYLRNNNLADHITVLDNLSVGNKENLDGLNVRLVEGDLRNVEDIKDSLWGINKIVHLGAATSVTESVKNPQHNFDVNVVGTYNLLSVANEMGVECLINASTGGALFGDAPSPVSEANVPKPISPYGSSKLATEAYCSCFSACYDINAVTVRFSNVYGRYSKDKDTVISLFLNALLQDDPLIIFGDGKQTRDYVFVEDLCEAIYRCTQEHQILSGEFFQLGSGEPTSVLELIELIKDVTLISTIKLDFQPERKGEVKHNYVDIRKAKKILGYDPKFSLKEGLVETWDYMKKKVYVI